MLKTTDTGENLSELKSIDKSKNVKVHLFLNNTIEMELKKKYYPRKEKEMLIKEFEKKR